MDYSLVAAAGGIAAVSIAISPKASSSEVFYSGMSPEGKAPGLLMLTLSQVTTWIFARSLMNAAILGFYYGIWGTLAYTAYYLSFLTGGLIVDRVRHRHGCNSIQGFLEQRFGRIGNSCYNLVVGLRLVSEVFANLLVIGLLFGAAGSGSYMAAVLIFTVVALIYSMQGGLHASLRTDVLQMCLFLLVLAVLLVLAIAQPAISLGDLGFKEFVIDEPGPVLLAVALLQIWSYPMHDPVMMDRGFIADRDTTKRSFMHAGWISMLCILAFGSLGVVAGAHAESGQSMNEVLQQLLGTVPMLLLNLALVISALSTLDSTMTSSARLMAVEMGVLKPTVNNGRISMLLFMLAGVLLVFWGNKDLFSAVAVSGTASMYLAPVIFFCIWGRCTNIPVWAYLGSFVVALGAAAIYFLESSGYTQWLGEAHKYTKLLWLSGATLIFGNGLFTLGWLTSRDQSAKAI